MTRPTRRYFLPIGVPQPGISLPNLPAVRRDLARMRTVFVGSLGYAPVTLPPNPSASELRQGLNHWLRQTALTDDDAVVIYYSGHGHIDVTGHYLYTAGFRKDALADGLRSNVLVDLVLGRAARPGKLWLILDCCHAGAILVSDLFRELRTGRTDIFVLAASGAFGQAIDGAFSGAFQRATRRLGGSGVSLDRITAAINAEFARTGRSVPALQIGMSTKQFDLLDRPNLDIVASRAQPRSDDCDPYRGGRHRPTLHRGAGACASRSQPRR